MPIKDLQKIAALRTIGRIRLGTSTPKGRGKIPHKSETLILSSPHRELIDLAASKWGGEVEPFEPVPGRHEWRVITATTEIPVYVLPIDPSQWLEFWDGGECQRRCDGELCQIRPKGKRRRREVPCICRNDEFREAGEELCKPTSRFSFFLPDMPELGVWVLETHGFYAAVEMPTMAKFAQVAGRMVAQAFLALEKRSKMVDGEKNVYVVPVIRTKAKPVHLALEARQGAAALDAQAASILQGGRIEDGVIDAEFSEHHSDETITEREILGALDRLGVTQEGARRFIMRIRPSSGDRLVEVIRDLEGDGRPIALVDRLAEAKKAGVENWDQFEAWAKVKVSA